MLWRVSSSLAIANGLYIYGQVKILETQVFTKSN